MPRPHIRFEIVAERSTTVRMTTGIGIQSAYSHVHLKLSVMKRDKAAALPPHVWAPYPPEVRDTPEIRYLIHETMYLMDSL